MVTLAPPVKPIVFSAQRYLPRALLRATVVGDMYSMVQRCGGSAWFITTSPSFCSVNYQYLIGEEKQCHMSRDSCFDSHLSNDVSTVLSAAQSAMNNLNLGLPKRSGLSSEKVINLMKSLIHHQPWVASQTLSDFRG